MLRHTFCTHLAEQDTPVEVIRELAGHADIRITTIYTDVSPDRLERAITQSSVRRTGARRLLDDGAARDQTIGRRARTAAPNGPARPLAGPQLDRFSVPNTPGPPIGRDE
ncbi:MAG: tyrosine-type recombinase/integrase [Solirubrobacteraceae bacterium]